MVLFDNHNHSQFSFDGKRTSVEESARAASAKGLGGMAFTDHCDFFVPQMKAEHEKLVPETFDISAQQEEIDRIQDITDIKILKGIEIGMHEDHHADIRKLLEEHSFDQIVASVHYLDGVDPYYGGYYEGKDWKRAYGLYLETIHKEMTWLKDFDIMGHFDYIVRYAPYPQTCMKYRDFSDILDEMLRYLIHEGKALEINTHKTWYPTDEILRRYYALGGRKISFGSDSHRGQLCEDYEKVCAYLLDIGFTHFSVFRKHEESLVEIPRY